ncbi:3786_t:CDS:2 [Acaulospora colombiana]|uniref:3786_t:CDS:1 n=1 Tax=Acaulospora colombiana TaxID=27376 RepID=A0ACA9LBR2_9GLOM|nr:3786_t:CDS:2 [Acaulospora colombiana]
MVGSGQIEEQQILDVEALPASSTVTQAADSNPNTSAAFHISPMMSIPVSFPQLGESTLCCRGGFTPLVELSTRTSSVRARFLAIKIPCRRPLSAPAGPAKALVTDITPPCAASPLTTLYQLRGPDNKRTQNQLHYFIVFIRDASVISDAFVKPIDGMALQVSSRLSVLHPKLEPYDQGPWASPERIKGRGSLPSSEPHPVARFRSPRSYS